MITFKDIHLDGVEVIFYDIDGCMFSEALAYEAATGVMNEFLRTFGAARQFTPDELRVWGTGKNFRKAAVDLLAEAGNPIEPELVAQLNVSLTGERDRRRPLLTSAVLEWWATEERRQVVEHLRSTLKPDPQVLIPLTELSREYVPVAVSGSASPRLEVCFEAMRLDRFFPKSRTYSAEDSLPEPRSKPDPAIYNYAIAREQTDTTRAIAIEDSRPGAEAGVAAGLQVIGNILFVPEEERPARIEELRVAGVAAVATSWWEILDLVRGRRLYQTGRQALA